MARTWLRAGVLAAAGALVWAPAPVGAEQPERVPAQGWIEERPAAADTTGAVVADGRLRAADPGAGGTPSLGRGLPGAPVALATFPSRELDRPTEAVDVAVGVSGTPGGFLMEVRGMRPGGGWTEWRASGQDERAGTAARIRLPAPSDRVQVRVGVGEEAAANGDALSGVRYRPAGEAAPGPGPGERTRPDRPFAARVFATRIGLVGETTANGHVVRPDDHFVALPSRRGLAAKGGGEYTVRVCTEDPPDRCAYAPVWDVGPWNIKDDHWNGDRQMWQDLPHGVPQAQAAYTGGHNGGRDGFGRTVRNPAGIDLADGTFRDALELPTNAWVRVDYLWTSEPDMRAEVATASESDPVIIRTGPGLSFARAGLAAHAARVPVQCGSSGDRVSGPGGATGEWLRIGDGHFIPAAFTKGGADAAVASCAEAGL